MRENQFCEPPCEGIGEARRQLKLARLVLRFGQVKRATLHLDGTPESDTTHTVMLALVASGLAQEMEPDLDLDVGLVAQLALVHDLCEAYAGDVNTARPLSPEQVRRKAATEAKALSTVRQDLAGFPHLVDLLITYEAQLAPEARFVRYVDKMMPKLTHALNAGLAIRRIDMTVEEMRENHRAQGEKLRREYPEFPGLANAFATVCAAAEVHCDV